MANTDKNIVITPNIGSNSDPKVVFSGANTTLTSQNIVATMYPSSNGTLSFETFSGSSLLSLVNTGAKVGIGTTSPSFKLEVSGTGYATTDFRAPIFYDSANTSFYVDPASTSILSGLTVSSTITGSISGTAASETLATVTARGASTSTAVTLSSMGNHYGGHFYYDAYDAAGNHYPHFTDGGNASGAKINWRLYTGAGISVTHAWQVGYTYFANRVETPSDMRATVFYDQTDTSYFTDPASRSVWNWAALKYNSASGLSTWSIGSGVLGAIHFNNGAGASAVSQNQAAITFQGGTADQAQAGIYVLNNSGDGTRMAFATTDNYTTGPQLAVTISNTGIVNFPRARPTYAGNTILDTANIGSYAWTSANDGSGSGLDADTIDGYNSDRFLRTVGIASNPINWNDLGNLGQTVYQINQESFDGTNTNFPATVGYKYGIVLNLGERSVTAQAQIYISHAGNDLWFRGGWNTVSWQSWNKVWTNLNDGTGSGLDADLLDGSHASAFALVGQTMYIGTTGVAINRGSASLALTGITSIDGTSAGINVSAPTLAIATESNSIYISAPSYTTDTPVKLLNFDWYGNVFSLGNIRSGATPSSGFGVYYTASGGSRTEIARFGTDSSFNVVGTLKQSGNAVWHSGNLTPSNYLPLAGGTMSGTITFSNSSTSYRGCFGTMADNDQWFVGGGATGSNAGFLEISTGDDGTEPIYVRQYSGGNPGTGSLIARTLTLLDGSGNTSIPGNLLVASSKWMRTGNLVHYQGSYTNKAYTGGSWYRFVSFTYPGPVGADARIILRNSGGHDSAEIILSKHTPGNGNMGVHAEVKRKGSYSYTYNITKFRLCDDGINSVTHIEVCFGANHTNALEISVEGFFDPAYVSFPDMTAGAAGATYTKELVVWDSAGTDRHTVHGYSNLTNDFFYINSQGRVGIMTSAPTKTLDVRGTIYGQAAFNPTTAGGWTDAALAGGGAYGGGLSFIDGSAGFSIWTQDNGATLLFGYGATSGASNWKAQLNSSGNLTVAGNIVRANAAEGKFYFKDSANTWEGSVGFTGNQGSLSFPGRHAEVTVGYNCTLSLLTGASGYDSGIVEIPWGVFKCKIMYDYSDNAYYVDPAGTSSIGSLTIASSTLFNAFSNTNTDQWPYIRFGPQAATAADWDEGIIKASTTNGVFGRYGMGIHTGSNRAFGFYSSGWNKILGIKSDQVYSYQNFYAPIMYDSNNTGYYLDPNSNSVIYTLSASTLTAGEMYSSGWFRNTSASCGLYSDYHANHWYANSSAYWNLAGTNNSYCGIIFRPEGHNSTARGYVYADTSNNVGFLNNGGSWRARVVGGDYFLVEGTSVRAPYFYDSDDTAYFGNFASLSKFNTLKIGNQGTFNDNTTYALQLSHNNRYLLALCYNNTGSYPWLCHDTYNTVSSFIIHFNGVADRFWFESDGDFTANGNVTAYSDIRLKKNIQKIDNALFKVNQLNGYTFERTDIGGRHAGVIAQEVIKVLPEVVHGSEETTYSVAYGNMVGLLIEAIKEQQTQIEELRSQINTLVH